MCPKQHLIIISLNILLKFSKNSYDSVGILNTICNATEVRQTEAGELASMVDAMIVIGGRTSSNTQKLYDICKKVCKHTFYIQNADDMDYNILRGMDRVGITAGASTPNIIIEEVLNDVRFKFWTVI